MSQDLEPSLEYFQLVIEPRMGQIIEPTKLVPERHCDKCNEYERIGLAGFEDARHRELYFSKQDSDDLPIRLTWEVVGDQKWLNDSRCNMIVSQDFYQAMREARFISFKCITAIPAHFV